MFFINPFAILAETVPLVFIQGFVVVMALGLPAWWEKCRAVVFRHFSQFSVTFRKIGHHLERVDVSEPLVCADRLSSSRAFKRIYEVAISAQTISKCIFRRGNTASFRYSRAGTPNVVLLQSAVFAVSVSVTFRIFASLFIVFRHFWLDIFFPPCHQEAPNGFSTNITMSKMVIKPSGHMETPFPT